MPYLLILLMILSACTNSPKLERYPLSPSEVKKQSKKSEWREIKQENLVYMTLPKGQVIFELAPWFAPEHVDNIKNIVLSRFWDKAVVMRSHDNYVAQWGDEKEKRKNFFDNKKWNVKKKMTQPEFEINYPSWGYFQSTGDPDSYAADAGYFEEFPAAHDQQKEKLWLLHCYGMVGVSRDVDPLSGNGESLYVVTGHSPRHLDRNINLVGRVVEGIELLTSLKRGKGRLGFYENKNDYVTIKKVRLGNELKKNQQKRFEILKTSSESYQKLIAAKKARKEEWFYRPAGHIEVCNARPPIRTIN